MMLLLFFVWGLIVGSFLNVCIHRMPQDESVVFPASHCPKCKTLIRWYDNVPVLSFILLKGKCRNCKAKISPRYMVVEFLSGLIWVLFYLKTGISWQTGAGIVLFSILLAATVTDLETGLIPDWLTIPGLFLGFIFTVISPALVNEAHWIQAAKNSGLGMILGAALIWFSDFLGRLLFKKDSMGGGDLKLLAMIGAFVGWFQILYVFFLAPFLAFPVALYAKFGHKAETIPYGPYLAAAGAVMFLYGDIIIASLY